MTIHVECVRCPVARAAGAAAVCWKAGSVAVARVPVPPNPHGSVRSARVARVAGRRAGVAIFYPKVGFFFETPPH